MANPSGPSRLLWCGVVAGPLFVGVVIAQDLTTPGYDPVGMPISLHAAGDRGWIQTINFLVDGALLLGFALGLRRTSVAFGRPAVAGPVLAAVVGAGVVGAGLFATDPALGFPPGVPSPAEATGHSMVHDLSSAAVFLGLPLTALAVAAWLARGGERAWSLASAATGVVLGASVAALIAGLNGGGAMVPVAGVVQRATVVLGWGWIAALSLLLLRREAGAPR